CRLASAGDARGRLRPPAGVVGTPGPGKRLPVHAAPHPPPQNFFKGAAVVFFFGPPFCAPNGNIAAAPGRLLGGGRPSRGAGVGVAEATGGDAAGRAGVATCFLFFATGFLGGATACRST